MTEDKQVGRLVKDMNSEELVSLRDHLYSQLKDFSMGAAKTEYVLKRMQQINRRLAKLSG